MLLVKTTPSGQVEQFPYTLGDLRRDNPNTSYPKKIGDAILADNLIYHVMPKTEPEYDTRFQSLLRDTTPVKEVRTKQPEDEFLADVAVGETYETGRWVIGYTVENIPIEDVRAGMSCTKMQGVLTLGEANWSKVMNFYTTDATWVQKAIIDSAANWQRTSDDLKFIGYLIGFDANQMDALFAAAALVEA
jgi:hypothetical protein